jgi:ABC-2 type transport system ATP-binding protein
MQSPPAVATRGLTKQFGATVAVAGLDLDVPTGALFGLVGPNGAGKTTSLKMMTALLRPDAGTVVVDGVDVWRDPLTAKARFGALPDDLRLFERLTGGELLYYLGRIRRLDESTLGARIPELLAVLGLDGAAAQLVADYSQGMRKKIALAAAVLHAPRVLFLDEPFESVDPVSAHTIQEVLARFCAAGGTVIFSSHVLDVVERLCDRVGIVDHGRLVANGTIAEVRGGGRLEDAFVRLVGATPTSVDLSWLGPRPES